MTTLIRPAALAVVAAVALLAAPGPAQEKPRPPEPPKKPTVMQRKLAHAQMILEGLAKEDFDKIRTNADGLIGCVKDASWRINQTEKYLLFSNDVLRSAENLKKAAKDRKTDAAALAYVDLTLTCVKCHRYLRDEGITRGPDLDPLTPGVLGAK
jgi:hypothetical protein